MKIVQYPSRIFVRAAVLPLVSLLLAFGLIPCGYAQGLARLSGTVTDATGAAVAGAHVSAKQTGTGFASQAVANEAGEYVFPSLAPAGYEIVTTSPGFKTSVQDGIRLQADESITLNPVLSVGATTETLTVTSAPPQVDTTTGTLSQVIDTARVNDLPLPGGAGSSTGRNAASLTTLSAGVLGAPNISSIDQGNTKTFPVVVLITVNGSRTNMTNFLLDGGNNVDEYTNVNAPFPFPDALQEFSVQTSNYQAEYGQSAGGVVNMITKSGTNEYHGNAFEYLRNRIFNAHDHFATTVVNGVLTPYTDPLKRSQFGGTFGGPVGIPPFWKAQKGFFFAGYQGSRYRDVSSTTSSAASGLPTTANQAGQFSFTSATPPTTATCIVDPSTTPKRCFPFTQIGSSSNYIATIPTSRFDHASLALLNYIPVAAANGTPFSYLAPNSQNFDEFIGRYDQEIGAKDHFMTRYYLNKFHNVGVLNLQNLLDYVDQSDITYQSAVISETHTFNGHWLNNFNLNYQREGSVRGPLPGGIDAATLGVDIWQPDFPSIQSISVTGAFSISANPHATFQRSNITLADDVHWVKSSHDIAFGFHGEIGKLDVVNQTGAPGAFAFSGTTTNSAIASFFLGYLTTFTQSSGQYQQDRSKFFGGYIQDSWKATRRLAFNYGIRYEPFIPVHEAGGRVGQFNPTAYAAGQHSVRYPNAPAGLLFPGDAGVPEDGLRASFKNIMPRFGFALDVFGDGKTSLRGGGGLFYDTRMNYLFNNGWIGSTPFVQSYTATNSTASDPTATFSTPYGAGNGQGPFPAPIPLPSNTTFQNPTAVITFDPSGNFQVPLLYNWNLTVEQQLTPTLSTRVAYVASHGSHLFTSPEINPSVLTGVNDTAANEQARRAYQGFSSISESNMGGNSNYEALQGTLSEKLSSGLSATLNYTWSKSLDNIPYNTAVTSAGTGQSFVLPVYLPNYKRLDYGPSVFDHRNNVSLSYVWNFPKNTSGPLAFRAVINDWQTTGIVTVRSGDPLNVTLGKDASLVGLGTSTDVPNHTVSSGYGNNACSFGTPANTTCVSYLDPTAFSTPANGTFGNIKKDSFVGPRFVNWDAGLARDFGITERAKLQFRAEYSNLLNHTNLSDPNLTSTSAIFGRITSDISPRLADLALKLRF